MHCQDYPGSDQEIFYALPGHYQRSVPEVS